ncbi:MAG: hypothetical protein NZ899_12505 [Thermoguttaceae bacterium]|nr:hypothetical protein [Thermoguttaceae bacterium]
MDESLPGTKPNAGTLPADGATLSWEEQKRLLLSALEGQQAAGESARATWEQERIALQQALTEAQRQLAERDREILTLQKLLEEQSTHLGSLALGAAAIEELVAHDEIIQQERENARRLREEWEEKLRQAEVELSLERAKIARERAELEERARQLAELAQELQKRAQQTSVVDQAAQGSERSFRRKWFQQLGRGSAPSEKK